MSTSETSVPGPERPEELPPVEPPSAGFIIQLFLIPALIVAAVICVWLLFGKLAEGKTDWQQLVTELKNPNEHRRWRAALELAQVLRNEQVTGRGVATKSGEESLAAKPEVATAITELLDEQLLNPSTDDKDIKNKEFLARTLGTLNNDDIVLPTLARALDAGQEDEVRKGALIALARLANRGFEAALAEQNAEADSSQLGLLAPLETSTVSDLEVRRQLSEAAQSEEAAVRHLAAYALALVSGPDAIEELQAMLLDADELTRANAAVGLCRNGLTDGFETMVEFLERGAKPLDQAKFESLTEEQKRAELARIQIDDPIILRNSIRALGDIWSSLDGDQQKTAQDLIRQLASNYPTADVKTEARALINRVAQ